MDGYPYEAFAEQGGILTAQRKMTVRRNSFSIEEVTGNLRFTVTYFVLPNESFPALVRSCEIENVTNIPVTFDVLDGLTEIIPFGITTGSYKSVSNLNKSWAEVSYLKEGVPFYNTRSIPGDEAEVEEQNGGYFYLSFVEGKGKPIRPITDPELIFGYDTGFAFPLFFPNTAPEAQTFTNKYSCGFTPFSASLNTGETVRWNTLIGFHHDPENFIKTAGVYCRGNYISNKLSEAAEIEEKLTDAIETKTAVPLFDGYIRQSYLDNLLRGGYPLNIGDKVVHLFSRKHGDPERDYNFFSLSAEYFSQGNGNFRDVCQNRRSDAFFTPYAAEFNILTFFSLMQADGFNPLEIRGSTFEIKKESREAFENIIKDNPSAEIMRKTCAKPFTAGKLINAVYKGRNVTGAEAAGLLERILPLCRQNIEAGFGEGYWIDHWTYLMDLVESYIAVFPEKKRELLFENNGYRYFKSPVRILPRKEAYVQKHGKLRQYNSIQWLQGHTGDWLKCKINGEIYETNLFTKMISLALIKFASLDPEGIGVSMDGGKPGWNDAMNGLPGLFGSGVGESYELLRLIRFILSVTGYESVKLPSETAELLKDVYAKQYLSGFDYWNEVTSLKEDYRASVLEGVSGETAVKETEITPIFKSFASRLKKGLRKAEEMGDEECGGLVPTFLTYEPTGLDENNFPTGFACTPLPAFLEGPVRRMKTLTCAETVRDIHKNVLASEIYDKPLKMYRTSVSLDHKGYDIGRVRAFTPGWLERESVFLHMSMKYLLELLSAGLYDEFFEAMKTQFPPFLDPRVYGRSVTENSSFIASSDNPDPSIAGRGYVSRLSGSTAEVLSIWRLMFWGEKGFYLNDENELTLELSPVLPSWLFDENGEIRFNFLSKTEVTYRNPQRKDTFGAGGAKIAKIFIEKTDGETARINGGLIKGALAEEARNGAFAKMLIELA
jgi:hypothetical protein